MFLARLCMVALEGAIDFRLLTSELTTSIPGHITVREQSCYTCDNCLKGEHPCANSTMTGETRDIDLHVTDAVGHAAEDVEDEEGLADIISEGDIVAVVADDEVDDYYLLKLRKPPHTLSEEVEDDWGNTFPKNSDVVTGLYLQKNTT